ncbi:MAG: hypothetical protein AAGA30_08260 [Planctomycetota bacterium]
MNSPPMPMFDHFIGIDYSGAGTAQSRQKGIQVYLSKPGQVPNVILPEPADSKSKTWSRLLLHQWLVKFLPDHPSTLIGIDHGFSFPISYMERHQLKTWKQFLTDFIQHWPTDSPNSTVEEFRDQNKRQGHNNEFRLTEKRTAGAKSVFQFDVQGSVAKSTHAGLPILAGLKKQFASQVHFWPFDGWQPKPNMTVITEVFPSLFRNRYPRGPRTVDQQDAYSICRWMSEMQKINRLDDFFDPPLSPHERRIAKREGWILGVF